jgi:uncharacterized protein
MSFIDLLAAFCLMAVLEGLFLFVAPQAWKRMATQMLGTPDRALRVGGGLMIAGGLIALQLLRG